MLYRCETWKLTVADEARLRGVVRRKIRMCGVRLRDRVGVVVKIENIIQTRLWWYGHVMRGDISSQIREVMKAEITGKRKKDRQRESWEECVKDLKRYGLRRQDACDRQKLQERIKAKFAKPDQPG